ncbi:flagellar motor switch protein FliG [Shimia haliotis]|uniref:Flagellar motor switch protein FliG n=1 Tax=Shimia haliotis TaxID=1280847 RepID=A0A1I4BI34_9RHOB|nr:FliG C-terminal domain-containing protein [Shimia haliotis]SFK67689.1 flagellar motor switch protein FliG [Shimia haliotis]
MSAIPMAQIRPGASMGGGSHLSRKQKAAIIVRFLLNEGAELELTNLSDEHQSDLTYLMAEMGYIDRETLSDVLMEFAHELESIGLSFPNGISGALNVLEGKISPLTAARLRKEAGVRVAGQPWQRIRALPVSDLVDLLSSESIEVSAVLISKLDVDKAANLLSQLPGDKARRITHTMSMTNKIGPEAVDRIGLTLACQIDDRPPRAFSDGPESRLGAILNNSTSATRDDILTSLDETDADFAAKVRKTIFTYAHIHKRLKSLDVPSVLRDIDQGDLITAMTYATEGDLGLSTEFMLENIPNRLADQLREGVEDRGTVKLAEAEPAMAEITKTIREMARLGDIELIVPDED